VDSGRHRQLGEHEALGSDLYVMQGDNVNVGLFRVDPSSGASTRVSTSNWINTSLMTALGFASVRSGLYVMQGDAVTVAG